MDKENRFDLEDKGFFFIFGDINDCVSEDAIRFILEKNMSSNLDKLTLIISSVGGNVADAFAIIDTIKCSKIPVNTVGLGQVASSALMIFLSGSERILTPNTSVLSHQFFWGSFGKEHELFAVQKEIDLTSGRILNHYKDCTNLSEEKIKNLLLPSHDVWLSAQEALEYGVCDKIVTSVI